MAIVLCVFLGFNNVDLWGAAAYVVGRAGVVLSGASAGADEVT